MKLIVAYANSSDEYLQGVVGVYSSEKRMFDLLRKQLKEDFLDCMDVNETPDEYVDSLSDDEVLMSNQLDTTYITVHEFELDT
jgi:hypothetical protein